MPLPSPPPRRVQDWRVHIHRCDTPGRRNIAIPTDTLLQIIFPKGELTAKEADIWDIMDNVVTYLAPGLDVMADVTAYSGDNF